jgi:DNA anti-recombination protein RmuC
LDAVLGCGARHRHLKATWIRLFDQEGRLLPTAEEAERQLKEQERQLKEQATLRAEQERQLKEQERQLKEQATLRAAAAEAELARLRAQLDEQRS